MSKVRFLLLAASLGAGPVQAITPENGLWWNRFESGRGFTFDLQDNILGVTVFVYDDFGNPVFYQAVAELVDDFFFSGELHRFSNGQCITCDYGPPDVELGFAGPIEIEFLSDSTGILTWKGGTIFIERQRFGVLSDVILRMLGEWQIVMDFSEVIDDLPFFGDILLFDDTETVQGVDEAIGFRLYSPYAYPSTATAFLPDTGEHIIIVADTDTDNLAYWVFVETDRLWGVVESYPLGGDPTGFGFPVQGFRAASGSFVQTGEGPRKARAGVSGSVTPFLTKDGKPLAAMQGRVRDMNRLRPLIRQLEAQIVRHQRAD